MHRVESAPARVDIDPLATLLQQTEAGAEHCARRHGSEADEICRLQCGQFRVQPMPTRRLFGKTCALVEAYFASRLELEMLDYVGEIEVVTQQA